MLYAGTKRLIFAIPVGAHQWRAVRGELIYTEGHLTSMNVGGYTSFSKDPSGLTATFYIFGDELHAWNQTTVTEICVKHGQTTLARVVDQQPEVVEIAEAFLSCAS